MLNRHLKDGPGKIRRRCQCVGKCECQQMPYLPMLPSDAVDTSLSINLADSSIQKCQVMATIREIEHSRSKQEL